MKYSEEESLGHRLVGISTVFMIFGIIIGVSIFIGGCVWASNAGSYLSGWIVFGTIIATAAEIFATVVVRSMFKGVGCSLLMGVEANEKLDTLLKERKSFSDSQLKAVPAKSSTFVITAAPAIPVSLDTSATPAGPNASETAGVTVDEKGRIVCPKCGTKNASNRNVCFNCGLKFDKSSLEAPAAGDQTEV